MENNLELHENLIGMTFGELTVLSVDRKQGKHWYYNCQCSCKRICVVQKDHLIYGTAKTCGKHNKLDVNNMVGNTYGPYTVLEYAYKDNKSNLYYKCSKENSDKIKCIRRDNLLKYEK